MFTSQGQAKRFFVDKIAAQALTEATPLSDTGRQMLTGYHYLLIMIDQALRGHLRPWWALWR